MAEDVGKVCTCIPHSQDAGGGYTEHLLEYNPGCQLHSYHVWNPRENAWYLTQHTHRMKLVEGEIEVCDTCVNIQGNAVAWDLTWHALHKNLGLQVQHCWRRIEPDSERLVPFCEDPLAQTGMGMNTRKEYDAVPICPKCHRMAMAAARKEEWEKVTSEQAVHIFKVGWHIGNRQGKPKTRTGLERIRELLGR